MSSILKSTRENKKRNEDNNTAVRQGTKDMNPTSKVSSPTGTAVEHLNKWQRLHLEGKFNVYEPIPQEYGEPLPPLAVQWKEDAKRRFGKHENSSNR